MSQPPSHIDDAIADEMLRMHLTSTGPITAATVSAATLVYFVLYGSVEPAWGLNLWWWLFAALMAVRYAISKACLQDPARRQRNRLWQYRFALLVGLCGLMWGIPGTLLYPTEASGLRPISALLQMGVSAAGVMSLASVPVAYRSFFLAMMLPNILWLALTGAQIERMTALTLGLFTILLLAGGKRATRSIEDGVRLRHQLAQALSGAEVARQQAEHANAAKNAFLTNMSHELRTPLHGILSFARIGLGRTTEAKIQQYFSRIRDSGERLENLIQNLLELSQRTSLVATDKTGEIDIRALLDKLLALRHDRLVAARLTVSLHEEGEAQSVTGQYLPLERLFDQVLGNAIRYAHPDTNIRIQLTWHPHVVVVVIADQGVGIPEAELEVIFEQFTQSSRTRNSAGGTGLGLAIARDIVRQHGGLIEARNNADGGADFSVRLPINSPDAQER